MKYTNEVGDKLLDLLPERIVRIWVDSSSDLIFKINEGAVLNLGKVECDDWGSSLVIRKYKPSINRPYWTPWILDTELVKEIRWRNDEVDHWRFENGLVCEHRSEAVDKAEKMIKAAQA